MKTWILKRESGDWKFESWKFKKWKVPERTIHKLAIWNPQFEHWKFENLKDPQHPSTFRLPPLHPTTFLGDTRSSVERSSSELGGNEWARTKRRVMEDRSGVWASHQTRKYWTSKFSDFVKSETLIVVNSRWECTQEVLKTMDFRYGRSNWTDRHP